MARWAIGAGQVPIELTTNVQGETTGPRRRSEMPWKIIKRNGKYQVVTKAEGKRVGTHETRQGANRQMKALYKIGKKIGVIVSLFALSCTSPTAAELDLEARTITLADGTVLDCTFHDYYTPPDEAGAVTLDYRLMRCEGKVR